MTIEQMRAEVSAWYPSDSWRDKVAKMPDNQVIAMYFKRAESNRLKGDKR